MNEIIKKISQELGRGNVQAALDIVKREGLSMHDIFVPAIEESAKTGIFLCLSRHDVDNAFEISSHFLDASNAASAYETEEIIRQAIISSLKTGSVDDARKIQKVFKVKKEIMDEVLKHSILSIFSDGDMERVLQIRDTFPITREVADSIVEYCVTWGDNGKIQQVKTLFLMPKHA